MANKFLVTKFFKAGIKITIFTMCLLFCLLSNTIFAEDGGKKGALKENGMVSEAVKSGIGDDKNNTKDRSIGADPKPDTKAAVLENTPTLSSASSNNTSNVGADNVGNSSVENAGPQPTAQTISYINEDHLVNSGDVKNAHDNIDITNITNNKKDTKEAKEIEKTKPISKDINAAKAIDGVREIFFADNEQVKVVLSNRDINRVLVKGDKIQRVNGPTGLYMAKNDVTGSAYISLYGDTTFTIFISTVKGHNFSLLVRPKATPGRTIILEPTTPSLLTARFEETESYQKVLVTFIKAMINSDISEDYTYEEERSKKSKKTDFYGIADIKQIASYSSSHLLGVISEIKNKSGKPLVLKPSYFYQPGVRAVALSHQTIAPSASGLLYQVISRD